MGQAGGLNVKQVQTIYEVSRIDFKGFILYIRNFLYNKINLITLNIPEQVKKLNLKFLKCQFLFLYINLQY